MSDLAYAPTDAVYDLDETDLGFHEDGRPTLLTLANAIQVWSLSQNRTQVTFGEVALSFLITPDRVAEAVFVHPWLFTMDDDRAVADRRLEHEGE